MSGASSRGLGLILRAGVRRMCAPAAGQPPSRSLLGASVGATIGAITASIFAWPVADLVIAPYLIAEAMRCPVSTDVKPAAEREVNSLRSLLSGERARLCFLAGGPQEHREALACAASEGRPTARVSLREATAAHSMQMTLIDQLYKPLCGAPVLTCLGVYWLSLFDMLISDHAHTRHRDFCVVLGQLRRALRGHAPSTPAQPRPLLIIEHMYVPTGASAEVGGEGLSPMLRSLRQFLCAVSIDDNCADVLVLAPSCTAASESVSRVWRLESSRAERAMLGHGAVATALTQSEAVDSWLSGMRLLTAKK